MLRKKGDDNKPFRLQDGRPLDKDTAYSRELKENLSPMFTGEETSSLPAADQVFMGREADMLCDPSVPREAFI